MRKVRTKAVIVGALILAAMAIAIRRITTVSAQTNSVTQGTKAPLPKYRVLFNRLVPDITIYLADADGQHEHALLPAPGLNYSPSYSSDGQWVVYTSEQAGQADIYRIRPDGSDLQQLTGDPAFDDQGTLSPDGRTLAFTSTRGDGTANIWLLDLSSKAFTNLTKHHSGNFRPSWSPDGRWIAFTSDRDSEPGVQPGRWPQLQSTGIYVIRPDGTGLQRLTRKDGVAGGSSWSPDGRRVLFYETDELGAFLAKGAQSRTEIVSIDIASGNRRLHTDSNETKLSPHWLSDDRISYVTRAADDRGGLSIWNPNLRVDRVIHGSVRNPSYSRDGKRVVFERMKRLLSPEHFVATVSRDADFELLLTEPFPSFSRDGRRLLYSQQQPATAAATGLETVNVQDTSIEIMNADGTDKRTLFHRPGYSAFSGVFSPSGDEIALSVGRYFRSPGSPPAQIGLIKPDGSNFRLIVDDVTNNGFPSWSPDGTRLVFKRGRQLVIMSLADRKIVPLTDDTHYNNFPQWSASADRIMFTSDRDGSFELYTVRPNGTDLRRLTTVRGDNAHAAWCSDSEWVVFSSGRMGFKDEMAQYDAMPQPYGEIFAMRADGSDVRQLTDNKWEDASVACIRKSGAQPPSAASSEQSSPAATHAGGDQNSR